MMEREGESARLFHGCCLNDMPSITSLPYMPCGIATTPTGHGYHLAESYTRKGPGQDKAWL